MSLVGGPSANPRGKRPRDGLGRAASRTKARDHGSFGKCSAGNGIPFEEMIKLDYLYVTTWSLGQDLRLLLRTLAVITRKVSGATAMDQNASPFLLIRCACT